MCFFTIKEETIYRYNNFSVNLADYDNRKYGRSSHNIGSNMNDWRRLRYYC